MHRDIIDAMRTEAQQLEHDLGALRDAIEVMERRAVRPSPKLLPKLLEAPRSAKPESQKARKLPKPKKQKQPAELPEGVSAGSTLQPDYELNGKPLYLSGDERALFEALNGLEEGAFASLATLLEAAGHSSQPRFYATKKTLLEKLSACGCNIENSHGVGYRLVQGV